MLELRDAAEKALLALQYGDPKDRARAMTSIRKALIRTPDNFEECARKLFNSQAYADQLRFALGEANKEIDALDEKLHRLRFRHKKLRAKIKGIEEAGE